MLAVYTLELGNYSRTLVGPEKIEEISIIATQFGSAAERRLLSAARLTETDWFDTTVRANRTSLFPFHSITYFICGPSIKEGHSFISPTFIIHLAAATYPDPLAFAYSSHLTPNSHLICLTSSSCSIA
jgi:hypothetical protein